MSPCGASEQDSDQDKYNDWQERKIAAEITGECYDVADMGAQETEESLKKPPVRKEKKCIPNQG